MEGNDDSMFPSISSDGRYVSFHSMATNLVAGDKNGINDIFRHDVTSGETVLVSVSSSERQASGDEFAYQTLSSISGNGSLVAFDSHAEGLSGKDSPDDGSDIYLRNVSSGKTLMMNVLSSGKAEPYNIAMDPAISDNGKRVAFNMTPLSSGKSGVYVRDRAANTTKYVSRSTRGRAADDYCHDISISPDGRYVGFASDASNLVKGDTNGTRDVFLHDISTGKTTRVNVSSEGTQAANDPDVPGGPFSNAPDISTGGRYVAFDSEASNLVPNDTNDSRDVFVRDRQTNTTERISLAPGGGQGDAGSFLPSISNDGRFIAFTSDATNLVVGDTNGKLDVFVYDRVTRTIVRVSETPDGEQGDGDSVGPQISGNGEWVVFNSDAPNLVADDTNGKEDVFVKRVTAPDN